MADFLLDTFTGGGNLTTHVGETGAGWALFDPPRTPYTLANFVLDGAGSLGGSAVDVNEYIYGSLTPDAADYSMEIVGTLGAAGSFGTYGSFIGLFGLDSISNYQGFEFQATVHNSSSPTMTFYLLSGSEYHYSDDIDISSRLGLETTYRVEVTNARKTITVFINGTQAYTFTTADPVPVPTKLGFSMGAIGHVSNAKVSKVQGWTGAYVAPEETVVESGVAILPLQIIVAPVGRAVLPLAISVGRFGQAVLGVQVSVVDPAIASGAETVADGGNSAAVWGALVTVGGVDVSDSVLGEIVIEAEEGCARVADFTVHQTGDISIQQWTGRPVLIYIVDMSSGTARNAILLFSGIVDLPRLTIEASSIALSCTDNRQGIIAGLSRAEIDALVGGYWSPAVFDKAAASLPYANDRISTVAAALDLSPAGVLRLTPWAAKPAAELLFGEDDVLESSLAVDIAERGGMTNLFDINFGYRFPRLKAEGYAIHYDYLEESELGFPFWVRDGNQFLVREAVLSAIESAGGSVVSIDWIALPTTAQTIPSSSGGTAGVWLPNPATDPRLCLGFDAVVSFDFTQQAEEQHRITVSNAASIEAVGVVRDEISGALEGVYADTVAVEQNITLYKAGVTTIPPNDLAIPISGTTVSATPTLTTDSDRAAAEAAMQALVAVAMTKIFASHRNHAVMFSLPLNPVVDVDKTVAVEAQGVAAKGKVRKVRHRLNPQTAHAISEVELAICSAAGVGIVHPSDDVVAPDGIADGPAGVLAAPLVVWHGLAGEDGQFTITFPAVDDSQRQTAVQIIDSAFAAPLVEDLLTVTL